MLEVEFNMNLFKVRLFSDKFCRAITSSLIIFELDNLTLYEADILVIFFSFYNQVVRLSRAFISSLWEFILAFFLIQGKRRIPFFFRQDLRWWCFVLFYYNDILFIDDAVRLSIQFFTDVYLIGIKGFFYNSLNSD